MVRKADRAGFQLSAAHSTEKSISAATKTNAMHCIVSMRISWLVVVIAGHLVPAKLEECDNRRGICKPLSDCDEYYSNFHLVHASVKYCDEFNYVVCCPKPAEEPIYNVNPKRTFERECRRYDESRVQCATKPFIVDGAKAEPREFPFMALIGQKNPRNGAWRWKCGGTLISPNYVLTAAHCLVTTEAAPVFRVRLGDLDYESEADDAQPRDFGVRNYVLHYKYDDDTKLNDIGLLELDRNASYSEYILPACLPGTDGSEFRKLTATGWGLTKQAGPFSTHLRKVTLDRFSDDECKQKLNGNEMNLDTQLCAGSFDGHGDTCQGDSGGPLFVQHPGYNCLKVVVGITSWGTICGGNRMPSVYTRVNLYTDWIERIVWSL